MARETRRGNEKMYRREQDLLKKADQICQLCEKEEKVSLNDYKILVGEYRKLLRQTIKLMRIGDAQQDHLHKLQDDVKNILDNTGQGIFTTDENLTINDNYSAECLLIFDQKISNRSFIEIISPYNNTETTEIISLILNKELFDENDFRQKVLMQLLPEEIVYKDKILAIDYKIVRNEWKNQTRDLFMFVLTDISEKRRMEMMREQEKSLLETIVRIVTNNNSFKWLLKQYLYLESEGIDQLFNSSLSDQTLLTDLLREVHTFKGNFSMFYMPDMVAGLNELEQSIIVIMENSDKMTREEIKKVVAGYDLAQLLADSLDKIRVLIGEQYLELDKDEVTVEKSRLRSIEERLALIDDSLAKDLLQEIRQMQLIDFNSLLQGYPEYINNMAERNGKLIKPVQIVSSDIIMVDGERYYNFVKVLGHVFRNAVKHGIEEPAQRVKDGKSELGEISFAVKRCHNSIVLEVSDDGRGIDVEKLKETAMNKGLYNAEELNRCEQDDLMRLVFIDGISATDIPDELAGRGEGLAAVLKELQLLGGRVEIDSARNIGTTFKFTLPLD